MLRACFLPSLATISMTLDNCAGDWLMSAKHSAGDDCFAGHLISKSVLVMPKAEVQIN
jgi:hypothetical protein